MLEKYKEFADKFEDLCQEYATEDFDVEEVIAVCREVAECFGGGDGN